jgi:negative regulator of sigma E activity
MLLGVAIAAPRIFAAPAVEQSDAAMQLLHDAVNAEATSSFVGEVQDLQIGEAQSNVAIYRVEHRAPNLTRFWYVAPQALYGDSVVSQGETSYSVDIKHNYLIIKKDDALNDQVTLDYNFALLTENYRAVLAPDETLLGHPVHVILLINRHTGETTLRVHIDVATHLVLEKECYASNGSLISQMRFEQIRYTNDIPQAIFAIPQGLREVQGTDHGPISNDIQSVVKDAGFNAQSPRYLPDGFLPVSADLSDVHSVRTLHLMYSDGIRTVSLFENARGAAVDMSRYHVQTITFADTSGKHTENRSANYVEAGPITLLAWSEANLHFALVGDLSRPELAKIAASVVP